MRPSPPVLRRSAWLQPPSGPREGCEEFHDREASSSRKPWRSICPTIAVPCALLLQLWQVLSSPDGKARPSGCVPVSASCLFGVSPRPLTTSPFSFSAVCLVRLLWPCSSSRSLAITTPLAFCHGPFPMRSRALTAGWPSVPCVLRYACQRRLPAPTACASSWQSRSAPVKPPRSAPLPEPVLVTKKLISACWACTPLPNRASEARRKNAVALFTSFLPSTTGRRWQNCRSAS